MPNHPNRNWRAQMRAACDLWLLRWNWPDDGAQVLAPEQLRELLREAYLAGYTDGRRSRET